MINDVQTAAVSVVDLPRMAGHYLGTSSWHRVTQEQVNLFADATGDHQWIHTDPERAASGPFGAPIAHGYLTLSLAPTLLTGILDTREAAQVVNCGTNRVRFTAPLPVGSQVRLSADCVDVTPVTGGHQAVLALTFERDGGAKPVCVAEIVFRFYTSAGSDERT
jgi:acyl dehydratase